MRKRQGPRPLTAHFLTLMGNASSLMDEASKFSETAKQFYAQSLDKQSAEKVEQFLKAVKRYQSLETDPHIIKAPIFRSLGNTNLHYFEPGSPSPRDEAIFIIPSLINKATILDLTQQRSFVRYFAAQGYHIYLIEWGAPDEQSKDYDVDDYVSKRLLTLLEDLDKRHAKMHLMGFCMGSLMALQFAAMKETNTSLSSLACFAPPYDFHAAGDVVVNNLVNYYSTIRAWPDNRDVIEIDYIQMMFLGLDPNHVFHKFLKFADYGDAEERFEYFVAMEDWVNDGVPVSKKAADQMILNWYRDNSLMQKEGNWGLPNDLPRAIFMAEKDRIVPLQSSRAFADAIAPASRFSYACGHTSLIAGDMAREKVWQDYKNWLASHSEK